MISDWFVWLKILNSNWMIKEINLYLNKVHIIPFIIVMMNNCHSSNYIKSRLLIYIFFQILFGLKFLIQQTSFKRWVLITFGCSSRSHEKICSTTKLPLLLLLLLLLTFDLSSSERNRTKLFTTIHQRILQRWGSLRYHRKAHVVKITLPTNRTAFHMWFA